MLGNGGADSFNVAFTAGTVIGGQGGNFVNVVSTTN